MVYVYAKKDKLNKYIGKELSTEEIKETLIDMGMDLKGVTDEENPELKIELTAEKLDMISVVGIARAIKYYKGFEKELPNYSIIKGNNSLIIDDSVNESRPKAVSAIIRDAPMSKEFLDEIIEIQEKIHSSFGRNRKKAAIGIYPLEKINFPVHYKAFNPENIKFRPLESKVEMSANQILSEHQTGKRYAHLLKNYSKYPVFIDSHNKILSMPPIINSYDTGRVEEKHKDLFIEVSGNNINHLDNILKVLVTTFIEMGAKAESVLVEYPNGEKYVLELENYEHSFSLKYVNKMIGFNLKIDELEMYLNKMMFKLKSYFGDKILIEIPPFRSDIFNDVDIADDLARSFGYNNIIPKFPNIRGVGETLKITDFKERISENLTRMGFLELYTYMLSSTTIHFKNMNLNQEESDYIRLNDSEDQGLNMIREMILPDDLEAMRINRKNKYPQMLFECGWTIEKNFEKDTKMEDSLKLSVQIAEPKSNYTKIKKVFDTIMKLEEISFSLTESNYPFLILGRQADIYVGGKKIGFIGEVSPSVLNNFDLLVPVSVFEVNLSLLEKISLENGD